MQGRPFGATLFLVVVTRGLRPWLLPDAPSGLKSEPFVPSLLLTLIGVAQLELVGAA